MYIPKQFNVSDQAEIIHFIKKNAFGMLVTHRQGVFEATHVPIVFDEKENAITGHISLGNQQKHAILEQEKAIFIIQGPHAYITPTWYNHENVPTWNYQAVHLHGKLRHMEADELLASMHHLVENNEAGRSPKFEIGHLSEKYLHAQLRGVVGFKMAIKKLDAKYKLSQNRDEENFANVIEKLSGEPYAGAKEVADEMRKLKR